MSTSIDFQWLYYIICDFFLPVPTDRFSQESKRQQVFSGFQDSSKSRTLSENYTPETTLLSILAYFSNAVVLVISILPLIPRSSNLFSRRWEMFHVLRLKLVSHIPYYYYYYYYYTSCELFTQANPSGLSQESVWHQVSSVLQDSSQYSSRHQ